MDIKVQKRVAENLKKLRKTFGYTQEELAEKLHVHRTTYTAYESGKKVPGADLILDLAELYHVSADTILNYETEMSSSNQNITDQYSSQLSQLVNIYRQLSSFSKGCLMERANILLDRERSNQSPDCNSRVL